MQPPFESDGFLCRLWRVADDELLCCCFGYMGSRAKRNVALLGQINDELLRCFVKPAHGMNGAKGVFGIPFWPPNAENNVNGAGIGGRPTAGLAHQAA